jgi:chromatin modification-related protein VID21
MALVSCTGMHYPNLYFGSQESGMISNLSDGELSVPFPSEEVTEGPEEQAAPDLDSPMSEPPASPTRTKSPAQKEEDEEAEINNVVEAAAEVEFPTSHRSTPSLQRPREAQEKKEEEEEEEGEGEGEEEHTLPSDHRTSVPPSPRPPSRPASASSHHSPAVSRHSSLFRSPPIPSPSLRPVSIQPVTEAMEMDASELMEDIREESPQLMLPSSSPVFARITEIHTQSEDTSVDVITATVPSPLPIQEAPPRPMVIAVDVASIQPSLLIPTPTSPAPALPDFSFEDTDGETFEEPLQATVSMEIQHHHFCPNYNLPPLKALPPEYLRKGKSSKQKKKDKDKMDIKGGREEWAPLGFARWGAIIRANPIYKKVSRATKCLSTKDWSVRIFTPLWLCAEHLRLCVGRNYRAEAYAYAGARRITRKCGKVEL